MSHFLVMVIGDDPDYQLAPFHEYECTGQDDEFVVTLDKTEECRAEYEAEEDTYIQFADGTHLSPYSIPLDQFVRMSEDDKIKYPSMGIQDDGTYVRRGEWEGSTQPYVMYKLPEGASIVVLHTKEVKSFVEWLEYQGYHAEPCDVDTKGLYSWHTVQPDGSVLVFRKTNPSAKWDWYQEGGRWGDPLILKDGTEASQAFKREIDLNEMIQRPAKAAGEAWDWVHTIAPEPWRPWSEILAEYCPDDENGSPQTVDGKIDLAREVYGNQPQLALLDESDPDHKYHGYLDSWDKYLIDRATYARRGGLNGLCSYAYVLDRQWHQRGKMGWFGMSSGEMDIDDWQTHFAEMFDKLPDDALITMIDCHI